MAKLTTPSSKTPARKRILIVDDHPMMREGIRGGINREADLTVCGEAADARQALDAALQLAPDLAVVDVNLPGKSGLELVKDLKALQPRLPILAISMHEELLYAERMLRAGAGGYISKHQPPEELIKAIRMVLNNQVYVSREVSENLLRRFSGHPQANQSPMELLTDREFEIFQLIGKGQSPKDIARQLHLSAKTVAVHNAHIRKKFHVKNSGQLVRLATQSEHFKLAPATR